LRPGTLLDPACPRPSISAGLVPVGMDLRKIRKVAAIIAQCSFDPTEFTCMGTYFRNAGFKTAYFGKWHLCFESQQIEQHGFEVTESLKRTRFWALELTLIIPRRFLLARRASESILSVIHSLARRAGKQGQFQDPALAWRCSARDIMRVGCFLSAISPLTAGASNGGATTDW
jgi:hypothetical protein